MENGFSDVKLESELRLKDDFAIPTYEEWKEVVNIDLKGADFDKKLVTKTYENINLNPIYTKKDLEDLKFTENLPGFENFVRGFYSEGYLKEGWQISQAINTPDADIFNELTKNALERGQDAVAFSLDFASQKGIDADYADKADVGKNGLSISGLNSLSRALKGIDLTKVPLNVFTGFTALPFLMLFKAYFEKQNIDSKLVKGTIYADPISCLSVYGKLNISLEKAFEELKLSVEFAEKYFPNIRVIGACGFGYNSAGASAVQELGFVFASIIEYANKLIDLGLDKEKIFKNIRVTFGVSSNYFMEIAKLRAAKILWTTVVKAYELNPEEFKLYIHARTAKYNQTKYDPYVNMLRTTTEAFSAVLGGINSLHTNAFDEEFNTPDEFSLRIARNTQIILKEESNLVKLIDPAGGSYFVEKLTDEVAVLSWNLVKEVIKQGGIIEALKTEFIQNEIKKVSDLRIADLAKRKTVLVGTNMYANVKEKLIEKRAFDKEAFIKKRGEFLQKYRVSGNTEKHAAIIEKLGKLNNSVSDELFETGIAAYVEGATLGEVASSLHSGVVESISVTPLRIYRLAEIFEELRDITEDFKAKQGYAPKLFLATMGPVKQHKARADFSRGFFEVAGFDVIYPTPLNSVEEALDAYEKSGAKVVVICSTDETYPEIVPAFTETFKQKGLSGQIVLAGYPKEHVENFKQLGINEFIYLGCDAYALLKKILTKSIELTLN